MAIEVNVEKRVNFTQGGLSPLTGNPRHLTTEQRYHLDRERRLWAHFGLAGVVDGLTVTAAGDQLGLVVDAGTALDDLGRQIVLHSERQVSGLEAHVPSPGEADKAISVWLFYHEEIVFDDEFTAQPIRVHEISKIEVFGQGDQPEASRFGVLLANATIDAGGVVSVAVAGRKLGGLRLPHPAARITFDVREDLGEPFATLGGDLRVTGRVVASESLRVDGDVTVEGGLLAAKTGAAITGGLTVEGGPLAAKGGATITGGATVEGGPLAAKGGATITGGATVEGGLLTARGGATITGGATVEGGLLTAKGGGAIEGGPLVAKAGATVESGLLTAKAGATVEGGPLTVKGGAKVTAGATVESGLLSAKGGATVEGGLLIAKAGLTVEGGLLTAKGGATITGGATVEGGLLLAKVGANVTGGLNADTVTVTTVLKAARIENLSTRTAKHDIAPLTTDDAAAILAGLAPVRYRFNDDAEDTPHLGFIAEDVPAIVASADRRGVAPMEIIAVLCAVVREQAERLARLEGQDGRLERLERRLGVA